MAQLNDTIINGRLSVSDHIRIRAIQAPSSAGGTSYTLGNSNYGLVSNGTYVYWKYFGAAAGQEVTDRTAATALSSSGGYLVTERTVYYGLPYINNSHTYNSTNHIYAPITGGLAGQILVAKGNTTTPEWETPKIWHGTCSTDAATATKEVVCANFPTGTNLTAGTVIFVKFNTTNSAAVANLKLRVNSSTAGDDKPIKYLYNGDAPANIPDVAYLRGGQTYYFSYDGTNWVVRMTYNTNTTPYGVRIYHQTAAADWNYDDYPLIISRTRNSTFTALGNGSYSNNVYGIVFGDGTLTPTINPSTGVMKIPGGLNSLIVAGVTSLGSTLSVTGATILSDTLSVLEATTLNNDLTVTGVATFNGNVLLNSSVTADSLTTGSLLVTGNSTLTNVTNTSTLLPTTDNSYNIGASGNKYATIYATTLNGSLDGTITATNTAIANNDTLVFIDSSNSNKITASSIKFDGSTTSKFLSQKGTWEQISITLNGSANSSPSFYAPTGAGSSGQFLKSGGNGAPSWSALPTANTTTAGIATLGASGGAATYGHTHTTSVTKVTSGTSSVTLEYSAKYKITAGGTDTIITMPGGSAITLNGSSTTSASFYAPTSSGTSGQYLKSGGANTAPSWQNFPTIPTITLNGSSTTSPSFYSPTSAGSSNQILKSNGANQAPTWVTVKIAEGNSY